MTNDQFAEIQAHATLVTTEAEMREALTDYSTCRNCREYGLGLDDEPCFYCGYDHETGEIVEP
jgi:hypothetical protein